MEGDAFRNGGDSSALTLSGVTRAPESPTGEWEKESASRGVPFFLLAFSLWLFAGLLASPFGFVPFSALERHGTGSLSPNPESERQVRLPRTDARQPRCASPKAAAVAAHSAPVIGNSIWISSPHRSHTCHTFERRQVVESDQYRLAYRAVLHADPGRGTDHRAATA